MPIAPGVNDAHHLDPPGFYAAGDHEWKARHHELTSAGDPSSSPDPGMSAKACCGALQSGRNPLGGRQDFWRRRTRRSL